MFGKSLCDNAYNNIFLVIVFLISSQQNQSTKKNTVFVVYKVDVQIWCCLLSRWGYMLFYMYLIFLFCNSKFSVSSPFIYQLWLKKNPHNSGYLNIKIGKGKITYGYIPLTISESVGQQSSALRKMDTFQ